MSDLLEQIGQIIKAVFCDWIPQIANAKLGAIGDVLDALGIIKYIIAIAMGLLTLLTIHRIRK